MKETQGTRPKVLILSLTYFPHLGGAEVATREISNRIGADFDFDLVTARLDKSLKRFEKIDNINVYRVGVGHKTLDKYIFTFFGFVKSFKLYLKNKHQIIWPIMAAYASFAVLFKIFTKAKVVLTVQEGDPIEYIQGLRRFKIFKPIYKLYFKKIDHVQVISTFLRDWMKSLGVKNEKISVVPNGVTLKPNGKAEAKDKQKIGVKENEKIILTVSRLVEKNGVADLIEAFKIFSQKNQHVPSKLLIVGGGPLNKQLQKLAHDLKISDQVIFTGKVDFEQTKEYYGLADVFVRASLSEGFGNVFIEAMAKNLPIIGTPVGGITDFLQENQTGWLCAPKNPESIVQALEYILDKKNQTKVQEIIANAYKMVEEKYTWDKTASEMSRLFKEIKK